MARVFDTDAKYIATTAAAGLGTAAGTIALWYKPAWAYNDGGYYVLLNIINGSDQFQIHKTNVNQWCVGWYPNAEKRIFVSTLNSLQNQWNLLVLTYTNSPASSDLYVNNIHLASGTCGSWDTTNATIHVGNHTSAGYSSNCTLAHWMGWSRVLTLSELTWLWNNPAGDPTTIANILFNYGIGVASPDTDTQGNSAMTVYGSAATADNPGEETGLPNTRVSQTTREILTEVGSNALVSQVAREILANQASVGGILLNPDMMGGFRSLGGGYNI